MTDKLTDCRAINDMVNSGRIISKTTAEYAYDTMKAHWTKERLQGMFQDDRSFIQAALAELHKASTTKE